MKVTEVISETWYNPMSWGTDDATLQSLHAKAAQFTAAGKPAPAALTKQIGSMSTARNAAALTVKATEADAALIAKRMGNMATVAKLLGYFYITVDLYANLNAIEKDYNEGKINSAKYKEAHEAYVGLWVVQALVPWLAKTLRIGRMVNILVRVVLAIATLGGTVASGGALAPAAISGIVVEQAVFTAIQAFLASKMFENWAKDYMFAFATIGYIPDELYNQLRGLLSKIPGVNKIMKNPGDTFYQSQEKERNRINPEAGAKDKSSQDPTFAANIKDDPKAIVIAGQRVDDGKGGINPQQAAGPQVQAAIQLHPDDPMVQKYLRLAGK